MVKNNLLNTKNSQIKITQLELIYLLQTRPNGQWWTFSISFFFTFVPVVICYLLWTFVATNLYINLVISKGFISKKS